MNKLALLFVAAALAGCSKETPPPPVVDAGIANTMHAAGPVVHEKGEPAPTSVVRPAEDAGAKAPVVLKQPAPPPNMPAEVELSGDLVGAPKDSKLFAAINKTPCSSFNPYMRFLVTNRGEKSHWETEIFVPQGSKGYVCAWAVAKDLVVAAGDAGRELNMQGSGEVLFHDLEIPLKKLKPTAPPPGLLK